MKAAGIALLTGTGSLLLQPILANHSARSLLDFVLVGARHQVSRQCRQRVPTSGRGGALLSKSLYTSHKSFSMGVTAEGQSASETLEIAPPLRSRN